MFSEKLQKRQNQDSNIKRLVAQRRLYTKVKKIKALKFFIISYRTNFILYIVC